jgi:hypothetical protein
LNHSGNFVVALIGEVPKSRLGSMPILSYAPALASLT